MSFLLDILFTYANASATLGLRIVYSILFAYCTMLVLMLLTASIAVCWKYLHWGVYRAEEETEEEM